MGRACACGWYGAGMQLMHGSAACRGGRLTILRSPTACAQSPFGRSGSRGGAAQAGTDGADGQHHHPRPKVWQVHGARNSLEARSACGSSLRCMACCHPQCCCQED